MVNQTSTTIHPPLGAGKAHDQVAEPAGHATAVTSTDQEFQEIAPQYDQAIARLSPVTVVQDEEQLFVQFEDITIPARLNPRQREKLLTRLSQADAAQQWRLTAYPQTDEAGQIQQLELIGLTPPTGEPINWARIQGQVKGRDEASGRLFVHLRRNQADRKGNRICWVMTVQGSVPKPGRYRLECCLEAGSLVLIDGELLPNSTQQSDAKKRRTQGNGELDSVHSWKQGQTL